MMDHAKAKAIAAAHAPHLIIDDQHPDVPDALVVRKTAAGAPFSIHVSSCLDQAAPDVDAQEHKMLTDALDAAVKALGA
jgi:hypothetical protein